MGETHFRTSVLLVAMGFVVMIFLPKLTSGSDGVEPMSISM